METAEIAVPTPAETVSPLCSRCESLLDTAGKPHWCKKCRAKYQREYQALRKEMDEIRGYAAGCTAMRTSLAERFRLFGNAHFSAVQIWTMILEAPEPS